MFDTVLDLITAPSFLASLQQWVLAVTSVVTAASAVTALTPTKADDKIRSALLKILNFLALNIGNAGRKGDGNE